MDIKELEAWLVEGLDDAAKAAVIAALNRDSVKAKTAGLKQQNEYDAIQTQAAALQKELDGEQNKPGSRAYAKWYNDNYPKVVALQERISKYEAKYGDIEGGTPPNPNNPPPPKTYTDADIQRMIDERFASQLAPNIATVLKGTGKLVQKHMLAGRKTEIDFDALDKMMGEKKLTLEQAYDEWDKPEREKVEKAKLDAEVDRRVKEELQKRGATSTFPASADYTPGALSTRSKETVDKFDKNALKSALVGTFVSGEYPGASS